MKIAFLYLGIAAMGYLIAAFLRKEKDKFKWIGTVLPSIVTALIFLMGFRIGENEEVVGNIGTIGLQSLVMALVSMAFTLAATGLLRRALGYDRYGLRKKNGGAEDAEEVQDRGKKRKGKLFSKSTVRYLIAVISGFILGYLLVIKTGAVTFGTASGITGMLVTYGLYLMVFLVGMDMGFDGSLPAVFRETGARAFVFPLVFAASTLLSMLVMKLFVGMSMKEMMAIGCTFGWYSLGPNIIMEAGMITAGAYAFLTNFLRDMISILVIPWVAETFGYIETVGLPQAAAMDVCIATIEGATNKATTALAFFSGAVFTMVIPVFLPILVGL